jgi:hypothetical protein
MLEARRGQSIALLAAMAPFDQVDNTTAKFCGFAPFDRHEI